MSRLIVKNLPSSITEARLKECFSTKGFVTDVQLKYTKEGKFRRFGFVGFKTEEEAKRAQKHFHKNCIDTAVISVELCAQLGDPNKPKSWSKYAPDSSKNVKSVQSEESKPPESESLEKKKTKNKNKNKTKEEIKKALDKYKDDPLFSEFLETHSAKEVSNILKDDDDDDGKDENENEMKNLEEEDSKEPDETDASTSKIADKPISDMEYMAALKNKTKPELLATESKTPYGPKTFFTVKVSNLAYTHKKKHLKEFFKPLKMQSVRIPRQIKGIAFIGFKTERQMNQALNKNKSFLEGRQISVVKYVKKEGNSSSMDENSNPRWKQQEEALKNEESIAESGRIYIRNLAYVTTEEDIREKFEKYGPLTEVNLPIDTTSRKPKGFGIVTFLMPEHALKAYSELDGTDLHGRMLHILPGKAKTSDKDINTEGLSFKEKKELERRGMANSSHNWNSLFLGQNAVAEAIASTYNTTKEKVLEDSLGTSVAVRLALGETQLVEETRKFLEENGVHLDAFNQPPEKRSSTIILVKNLPAGTTIEELREKFQVHGVLNRIIMPPSCITALVEFVEPSEARKAFNRLAYTRFKHLPLYLEWAPEDTLTHKGKNNTCNSKIKVEKSVESKSDANNEDELDKNKVVEVEKKEEKEEDEEEDDEPESDTTIFVKNLNFSTTEETLKQHFRKCGDINYVSIAMKKNPKNPSEKLSMGYGFVRYKYKVDADQALKTLQMTTLDNKTLELKRSERTLSTDIKTAKKSSKVTPQTGTKIIVKNLPFQANEKEVVELFKAFGELKVRLPKKLSGDGRHRGFAFVEFYSKSDAKKAFQTLSQSTHFYGRRLVLEWAQIEEDVEDIRKRTAKHFHQDLPTKRHKKATLDLLENDKNE